LTLENLFSAHIGYLFNEIPIADRIPAAARTGFTAIEHPQPFAIPAGTMRKALAAHDLVFTQLAGGTGDLSRGEKGLAAMPGREQDFREGFNRALEYAVDVGCQFIHPMAGTPANKDMRAQDVYMGNIQFAVEQTASSGVGILIEAISDMAMSGYAVSTLDQAANIQDVFGTNTIALLLDTFHAKATGIQIEEWIFLNAYRIGHVHIADFPDRHEPGTGTLDFNAILTALTKCQYQGAIGFEYIPSIPTRESAGFLATWKSRQ
jgi:2-dehydrotetronate isomerase